MARPIKLAKLTNLAESNMNLIQSFVSVTQRFHSNIYEQRIILRLVEFAQDFFKGRNLRYEIANSRQGVWIQPTLDEDYDIMFHVSQILNYDENEDVTRNHYERIRNAFTSLASGLIWYQDRETGDWVGDHLLTKIRLGTKAERSGMIGFRVSGWFWKSLVDLSKGYTKYELKIAMKLSSPYSIRLYQLISFNKDPQTYSVEDFRKMFGLEDKYKKTASIIERVILPAKKELDEIAPFSFDLKEERIGNKKTSPISGFTFIPIRHEEKADPTLQKKEQVAKLTARNTFGTSMIHQIMNSYGFSAAEINRNKQNIKDAIDTMGLSEFIDFLQSVKDDHNYNNSNEQKSYLIGMIKNKTKDIKQEKATPHRHADHSRDEELLKQSKRIIERKLEKNKEENDEEGLPF